MPLVARAFALARFALWIQLARSHASFHSMRRIEDCDSDLVLHRAGLSGELERLAGRLVRPDSKVKLVCNARWSWGCVSASDSSGRTIWIADAHRDMCRSLSVSAFTTTTRPASTSQLFSVPVHPDCSVKCTYRPGQLKMSGGVTACIALASAGGGDGSFFIAKRALP